MKVRIVEIGPRDAFFNIKDQVIGAVGEEIFLDNSLDGFQFGMIDFDEPVAICNPETGTDESMPVGILFQVKVEEVI